MKKESLKQMLEIVRDEFTTDSELLKFVPVLDKLIQDLSSNSPKEGSDDGVLFENTQTYENLQKIVSKTLEKTEASEKLNIELDNLLGESGSDSTNSTPPQYPQQTVPQ